MAAWTSRRQNGQTQDKSDKLTDTCQTHTNRRLGRARDKSETRSLTHGAEHACSAREESEVKESARYSLSLKLYHRAAMQHESMSDRQQRR